LNLHRSSTQTSFKSLYSESSRGETRRFSESVMSDSLLRRTSATNSRNCKKNTRGLCATERF